MRIIRTDRSRIITGQRCLRARFLEYYEAGTGITSARKPLPLAVGGAVHSGLEVLLRLGQATWDSGTSGHDWMADENQAVAAALADFASFQNALDAEQADAAGGIGKPSEVYTVEQLTAMRSDYDRYLFAEQSALVEAMVRAYARRRLRPLLEEFEVLEVEREGEWRLGKTWLTNQTNETVRQRWPGTGEICELRFMSRPDALLRERSSNALLLLSFKTAASWDVRKARDAEHDMQGLSEGVEAERRLGEWWRGVQSGEFDSSYFDPNNAIYDYLRALPAPPRIHAIRYEYLLKGERWRDKDLAVRFGFDARSQKSHLVRAYANLGMAAGDEQWNWSWDYLKPDGAGKSNLYYKTWKAVPVWQHMTIREWIDRLDEAAPLTTSDADATGFSQQSLGYSCSAQATGTTESHPLDAVFLPPVVVYRQDDDLRDWLEQTEAGETRIAESAAAVDRAADEGERRSLLNIHFPQSRHSCEYPSTCQFVRVCYGGDDIRSQPLESGLFKRRTPNHPAERVVADGGKAGIDQ